VTKTEKFLKAWKQYEREHDHAPSSAREVIEWAVAQNLIELPKVDPYDDLAEDMSRILREETAVDGKGRRYRVNQSVRVTKNGVQLGLWGIGEYCSYMHTEQWFTQRREGVVRDCYKLKIDVDHYNDINSHGRHYQLELDFSEDVAEQEMDGAA